MVKFIPNNRFMRQLLVSTLFTILASLISFSARSATIETLRDYCTITEQSASTDGDHLAMGFCLGYLMGMKDETAFWCYLRETDLRKNRIVNLMARDTTNASLDAFRQSFLNWVNKFPNTWSGETASIRKHMLGLGSSEVPFPDFRCN